MIAAVARPVEMQHVLCRAHFSLVEGCVSLARVGLNMDRPGIDGDTLSFPLDSDLSAPLARLSDRPTILRSFAATDDLSVIGLLKFFSSPLFTAAPPVPSTATVAYFELKLSQ